MAEAQLLALMVITCTCSVLVKTAIIKHSRNEKVTENIDVKIMEKIINGYPDNVTNFFPTISNIENEIQNPEELGAYLEGDIFISERNQRNGIIMESARWPGALVAFEINGKFTKQELGIIRHAINEYHKNTCVRFKQRFNERDYISITKSKSGCWSSVGRLGGKQEVNLESPMCFRNYGTTIHELMHALGFLHEQNRYERDEFVQVLKENVKPGMLYNFEKASSKIMHGFGISYDYASVMHYSATSFSKNGKPTLKALKNSMESKLMGQRYGFSTPDIQKINIMYNCK